jgi:hypothetical protein
VGIHCVGKIRHPTMTQSGIVTLSISQEERMTSANPTANMGATTDVGARARPVRRVATETKASYKTTEFFTYLAAVAGVLIASLLVGTGDGHSDYFRADRAWFFITLLTIGYMISRGLAKAGSREPYDDER